MDSKKLRFQQTKIEKLIDITDLDSDEKANLKDYLIKTKFYTKPGAIKHHHNYGGGLAEHSLEVYENLKKMWKAYNRNLDVTLSSVIIVGLLHDVCKVDNYELDYGGKPIFVNKELKGHGGRSVNMLKGIISLSEDEEQAILYHMGQWTSNYEDSKYDFSKAIREGDKGLFIYLTHVADMISAIGN